MIVSAVHKTDRESALSILREGFDLSRFGSASRRTGQTGFNKHLKGIYLTADHGFRPEDPASHPWDNRDRGVLVFCAVRLDSPMFLDVRTDGKFYQEWLSDNYGGISGARLTAAIKRDGHDGIVCGGDEIIAFEPSQIGIDKKKTEESLAAYSEWRGSSFREWLSGRKKT